MNTAAKTRELAYGTIDSRRAQAIAVRDGTLAMAVGQILSKSRAFAVSSRPSPRRFLKIDFNCVIRSKNVRSSL